MLEKTKLCISVPEVAEKLGISRPKAYELVQREGFPKIQIDRRILIPVAGLEKWLEVQAGTGGGGK
jgi:DNA binding domain, excisionase family